MLAKEKLFSSIIRCGHCGNLAPMEIVASFSDTRSEDGGSEFPPYELGDVYELLKCPACRAISFRSYFWNDGYMESDADVSFRPLYPSDVRLPSAFLLRLKKLLLPL